MTNTKPLWHALPDAKRQGILGLNRSWQWLCDTYAQPEWCGMAHPALGYMTGCWGLIYGHVGGKGEGHCRECEYYKG